MANASIPEQPEKLVPDMADVSYGPHERHVIDFWRSRSSDSAPLVVYIHGGGFSSGDKTSLPPHLLHCCLDAGFAVAAINYRLSNAVAFPGFMHDGGRAIQFMRSHAGAWGIHPDRMAATGGSAGGGISMWLGFHPDLADVTSSDPVARQSTRLTCLGVYNTQCSYDPNFFREAGLGPAANHRFMPPFYGLTYEEMERPEARRLFEEAAPMTWFHAGGPPVFLYYPTNDDPLPPGAQAQGTWAPGAALPSDSMANRAVHHPKMGKIIRDRLHALGVECHLHIDVGDRIPDIQAQMVAFFKCHLLA